MAVPVTSDRDHLNASRITNLPQPASAQEPATKAYVDSAVEGLAWKDSVRVRTASNISLASPGASLDGVALAVNDRVLVAGQTAAAENGIYVWNGAAVAMTRAADASTADELEQAITTVEEGTSAGGSYRQTAVNFVLGTGAVSWAAFGTSAGAASEASAGIAEIATQAEADAGTDDLRIVTPLKMANWSGRKRKGSQTYGDGAATQYDFVHNIGTRDLVVGVWETTGTFRQVEVEVQLPDVNTVRVVHKTAPATNAYRVVVIG